MGRIIPYIKYMKWKIKFMFETTNQFFSLVLCFNMSQLYLVHAKYPPRPGTFRKIGPSEKISQRGCYFQPPTDMDFQVIFKSPKKEHVPRSLRYVYIYPNLANGKYSIYIVR
jgi:hypothetical protein